MFVITQSKTYKFPVKFSAQKEDGTGREDLNFTAVFKRLDLPALKNLMETPSMDNETLVRAVLVGWEGVFESPGKPAEFNQATLAASMTCLGWANAVVAAFSESVQDAPRKN